MPRQPRLLKKPAVSVHQNPRLPLYLFTLTGEELMRIADISRLRRDERGGVVGYQRGVVRRHVRNIAEYLKTDDVLFPTAIILALSSRVRFRRNSRSSEVDALSTSGVLEIPIPSNGNRVAWIVDGQQRAMALAESGRQALPVPVSAFVAVDIATQREHFLRVNSTRPLPRGLITELLPEIASVLPPNLSARKTPAILCELLNTDRDSPFLGIIRRASTPRPHRAAAVVADTALIKMLEDSLSLPTGCLFPYRNIATGQTDLKRVRAILFTFWTAVRDVFPEAWGLPPSQSRLMHSVGLRALGRLMDRVMGPLDPEAKGAAALVRRSLSKIAPECHWTSGSWPELGSLRWNELQNVPSHFRMLSRFLIDAYLRTEPSAP